MKASHIPLTADDTRRVLPAPVSCIVSLGIPVHIAELKSVNYSGTLHYDLYSEIKNFFNIDLCRFVL
jgi:hypothetical protein